MIHFHENVQRMWIDKIIQSALQISCKTNILQYYPCSFQNAKNKAHAQNKCLINWVKGIMHIINIIPDENFKAFWKTVLLQAEFYLKFQASVLMLSVYGLKLTSTCENPQMTCSWFL